MRIAIIVVVVLLLLGAAGAFFISRNSSAGAAAGTVVRIAPVTRAKLTEIISAPGVVVPQRQVAISARLSARITELPFREGASVKSGDIVVKLDATDIEANLRGARARYRAQEAEITTAKARVEARGREVEALQVQLTERQRNLERQKSLLVNSDVSASVVETAQSEVDRLVAQVASSRGSLSADTVALTVLGANLEAAVADIERIEDQLNYTTIRAPMDGIITKLEKEVGELAIVGTTNTPGTEILEIADLSRMLVETKVDETVVAAVRESQPADVRIQAYRGRVFKGAILTVALAQSRDTDGTKYYKTEVLIDTGGDRVLSGLTADVDIEVAAHEGVLLVPSQCVLGRAVDDMPEEARNSPQVDPRKTLTTVVYRLVDGKAVITPVRVGPSDVTHTVIEAGLNEGDLVIAGPFKVLDAMKHNDPVRQEGAGATTTRPATAAAPTTSP